MDNKRIGIITFHRTTNFGSVLQTYGLYAKLKSLGCEPMIIDYRCPAIERREQVQHIKDFSSPKAILKELLLQPYISKKANELYRFTNNHMFLSQPFYPDTIINATEMFDKFLVGSDIVWGLDITEGDTTYFLDFVEDKKRKFAFSSSIGHRDVTELDKNVAAFLSDFSRIAVREEEGAEWVQELTGRLPEVVCDPTMLLTIDEWTKVVPPQNKKKDYVLVYFDNDDHKCSRDAYEYAKTNGLKALIINYGRPRAGLLNVRPTTLNEFLGLIQNAERVFTSSYHGILFSIYFHKKFVYYTRAHKSRVISLEKRLGMNRCADFSAESIDAEIDYERIDREINKYRQYSIKILQEMIY